MAQLICRNLCPGYDGRAIISDLNFEIFAGDYLCVIGENGSGKSTLMRTILGLQAPVSGDIVFDDGVTKNQIGYLPQQTAVQKDFPATVYEIVLSGNQGHCGLRPYYTAQEKKLAEENIERLGITELKNRSYRTLSGGQQQRTLLARALCATEKILLLDEPAASLDPMAAAEMYGLVEKLNREGVSIIMISHDMDAALHYANKILRLGKSVFFGTKEEYTEREAKKQ